MSDAMIAHGGDLLHGVAAIAAHLNVTRKQVYHMHDRGQLPTFKIGRTVCARRSTLARTFAEQEAAARTAPAAR
jgi:hypothetical protein